MSSVSAHIATSHMAHSMSMDMFMDTFMDMGTTGSCTNIAGPHLHTSPRCPRAMSWRHPPLGYARLEAQIPLDTSRNILSTRATGEVTLGTRSHRPRSHHMQIRPAQRLDNRACSIACCSFHSLRMGVCCSLQWCKQHGLNQKRSISDQRPPQACYTRANRPQSPFEVRPATRWAKRKVVRGSLIGMPEKVHPSAAQV